METEEVKPFTWLKKKYTQEKTKGKYKGGSSSASKRSVHKKNSKAIKPNWHMVMEIYGPGCNKTRWFKELNVVK